MLAYGVIVSTIVGSFVLIAVTLRQQGSRDASHTRRGVAAGMLTFFVCLGALVAMQTPSDWVIVGTSLLFVATSAWFAVLEWRLSWKR